MLLQVWKHDNSKVEAENRSHNERRSIRKLEIEILREEQQALFLAT
jgi:hypothetical protein